MKKSEKLVFILSLIGFVLIGGSMIASMIRFGRPVNADDTVTVLVMWILLVSSGLTVISGISRKKSKD